jgi:hypothetical protein
LITKYLVISYDPIIKEERRKRMFNLVSDRIMTTKELLYSDVKPDDVVY